MYYKQMKWKQANKAKEKQTQLYNLKNETIRKLEKLNMVEKVGIHIIENKMLTSIRVGEHKFHILPTDDEVLRLHYLGAYKSSPVYRMNDIAMPVSDAKALVMDLINK